jgi:hypothetical protein
MAQDKNALDPIDAGALYRRLVNHRKDSWKQPGKEAGK